jgi:ring-1,2-phenylacetyl-CoA epoxidase subunit PaaD
MKQLTTDTIYQWLEEVKDPEIPVLSLVDLGVITAVELQPDKVKIIMTPTFVGCPALDMMKEDVTAVLKKNGIENVEIEISYKRPWTSDFISEKGKSALKKFGLAPPPKAEIFTDLEVFEQVPCPRCDGTDTVLKNAFGPTLCRSIHFCNTCHEAFEQFKPL